MKSIVEDLYTPVRCYESYILADNPLVCFLTVYPFIMNR